MLTTNEELHLVERAEQILGRRLGMLEHALVVWSYNTAQIDSSRALQDS